MKRQFVSDIKAGETVDACFVVAQKTVLPKKDGQHYLNLVLSDRSGQIKAVAWDQVDRIAPLFKTGDVVRVKASAGEYKGTLQLTVREMTAVPAESVDLSDFMEASERDVDTMFERIVALAASLSPLYLKALFQAFWQDETFVSRFKAAPAAKKMHHAYLGGLLEHTLSMALLAEKICSHYSGVDRDLLLAGVLLHDIGKTREFRFDAVIDYSDEGRLLNHITIGIQMMEEKLRIIDSFPEEKALLLKHMVVSHHGTREFGSPEPPKTIEAVLLNYIDEIDSKVQGIREFMGREKTDEPWTSFHRLLERHFYRGKKETAQEEPASTGPESGTYQI